MLPPQLVYGELESELLALQDPLDSQRQREEQYLLQGGASDYASSPVQVLSGLHTSNILVVRLLPGGEQLITGTGKHANFINPGFSPIV
jgi:hypothetical protein